MKRMLLGAMLLSCGCRNKPLSADELCLLSYNKGLADPAIQKAWEHGSKVMGGKKGYLSQCLEAIGPAVQACSEYDKGSDSYLDCAERRTTLSS